MLDDWAKRLRHVLEYAPPREILSESTESSPPLFVASYPYSEDQAFQHALMSSLNRAHRIVMIGYGLNPLWQPEVREIVAARANEGASVRICLADVGSPAVAFRLGEEELRHSARMTLERLAGLVEEVADYFSSRAPSVQISVFRNYLTFATVIVDDNAFVYPYAYELLGNDSPVFHLRLSKRPDAEFFASNAERVLRDATPFVRP